MILEKIFDIQRNLRAKLSFFYNKKQTLTEKDQKLINELILKAKNISIKNKKNYKQTHKIFSERVLKLIISKKVSNFLQISFIQKMFFVHNRLFLFKYLNEMKKSDDWNLWKKLIQENHIGNPVRFFLYPNSSGNKIFQTYHLKKYIDHQKIKLDYFDVIFEFGGGYGNLATTFKKVNKNCKYIIFDTPEVNLIQYYYLKKNMIDVNFHNSKRNNVLLINSLSELKKIIYTYKKKRMLFIANWSLSETPLNFRKKLYPLIKFFDFQIISYQHKFENINNIKFFKNFNKKNIIIKKKSKIVPIKFIKNNYYLFSSK